MLIPSIGPVGEIGVDVLEEKPMDEPDVPIVLGSEAVVMLQCGEEVVPLVDNALGYVDPETFNTYVIDAPGGNT